MNGLPRALLGIAVLGALAWAASAAAAERAWQTGRWVSAGVKHDLLSVGPGGPLPTGPTSIRHDRPEVATYVIDTESWRLELEDTVPIGTGNAEADFEKGAIVTVAVEKNIAYLKGRGGNEFRLRVTRKLEKPAK